MKKGDAVKVVKCIDDAVPIESRYIGKIGIVTEINNDRPSPISVEFDCFHHWEKWTDSFWPEELEIIRHG